MERFQYEGSAPGANTNATTLFDSTVLFGVTSFGRRQLRTFALTLKNSHSGSVRASMRDADGNWQAFLTKAFEASPAGGSNPLVFEVGHCSDLLVEWVNGGSAQTTWFAAVALSELDRDAFRLTDDVVVTGNQTITGTLELGDTPDVEALLVATSRGYRGVRAVTAQIDTAVLDDAGKLITCAHATSTAPTIPPEEDVAFAAGEWIDFTALDGAGDVTLTAGLGVTVTPATGKTLVLAAAGIARVTYLGGDVWVATGDLVAA